MTVINLVDPDDDDVETAPAFSEEALALEFVNRHSDHIRYVAAWNKWMHFVRTHWGEDETRKIFAEARGICRAAANAVNKKTEAKRLASARTRAAVVSLSSDDQRLAATIEQWDLDDGIINALDATVNLITGRKYEPRWEDYMTKIAAAKPEGDCPTWLAFLDEVTAGDTELQAYLQRVCGYCLTGLTTEHAMFFLWGTGANGKSVFINTIAGMMGDYAVAAPMDTFIESRNDRHPTELAMLRGARLVVATETEEGRNWAEAKLARLTGGDPIRARFMRGDFFEFTPKFKLMVGGNHKPGLRNVNEAIKRRMHLIPFTVTIPEERRDPDLTKKLKAEWGGIMQWAIKGCAEWQRIGLNPPQVVTAATTEYLEQEDSLGRWLDECCVRGVNEWDTVDNLFRNWLGWAARNGEQDVSSKRFSQQLEDAAFGREKRNRQGGRGFRGLRLAGVSDIPAG